jgi:hypothetical protein
VSTNWNSLGKELIWPVAGIGLGALAATNSFYQPHVSLGAGIAVWFAALIMALMLSIHPTAARIGTVVAGLFFAMPCFLRESDLVRGLLMCGMALPFALLVLPLSLSATTGVRGRLVYIFTWLGTREAKRRARSFDWVWLLRLLAATLVLAGGMAAVKAIPSAGLWLLMRWLAGGIMILAWAEMVTAGHEFLTALIGLRAAGLMRSPHLSTSLGEFWAERWNPAASVLFFHKYCFAPLAPSGVTLALFGAFLCSAIGHALLFDMASGEWGISLLCGTFFLVQPLLIIAERRVHIRRWRSSGRRVWTLAALALTSPLFVEPALRIIEPVWGPPGYVLMLTLAVLGYVILVTVFFSLCFLVFGSSPTPSNYRAEVDTGRPSPVISDRH